MAILDIIIILLLVVAAILGFRKGVIRQVGSLVAIVVAILGCRFLGDIACELITGSRTDMEMSAVSRYGVSIIANSVIFLVIYFTVILCAMLLKGVAHSLLLGPIDRISGAALNVLKYSIVISLLINLYIAIFPSTTLLTRSRESSTGQFVEIVIGFAPWLLDTFTPVTDDTAPRPQAAQFKNPIPSYPL